MTTIGVHKDTPWRVGALRMPSYNYQYAAFKQAQLCDHVNVYTAKTSPIFRSADEDRKRRFRECLRREAAVASGAANFEVKIWDLMSSNSKAQVETLVLPPAVAAVPEPDLLVRVRIGAKDYARWRFETTPVVTTQARAEWNHFLNRCPERFDISLPVESPGTKPYYDGGYALRYLCPHLTRGLGLELWSTTQFGYIQGPVDISPFREIQVHNALADSRARIA
ncbi:unnamed protein product [Lymnaea stagnalis]|uniref:Uncharacterized protein n=1 Tax=Lymnaea stagnalis TaxID=6523 RepID=A0AAV2H463_LYMST